MISNVAARLGATRDAVLVVHRALLGTERIAWEALNGRVADNPEFLQLVIHDPWFVWLRPLTALIAAMDEALADPGPEADSRVAVLLATARELLRPDDQGDDFQQRYFEFVQRSPDVAVAHGMAMKVLAAAMA
ncbi:MAG TPA: hypothetical protein VGL65_11620 [Gemmatimonadales bacterium]|jgi:hypothetical protein